jgi:hypothetical protein
MCAPVCFFPLLISFVDYMNSEHCSITSINSQPTASTRASDNCAPDIMSLTAFPIELVSRVCRFLGREPSEYGKRIVYKNKDFQSLRSTCRDIYAKTTYDASVRYSTRIRSNLDILDRRIMEVSLPRIAETREPQLSRSLQPPAEAWTHRYSCASCTIQLRLPVGPGDQFI